MKRLALLILMLGLIAGCGGGSSSSSTTTNSLQYLISQIVRPQLDKHQRLKIGVAIGVVGPGAKGFGELPTTSFSSAG